MTGAHPAAVPGPLRKALLDALQPDEVFEGVLYGEWPWQFSRRMMISLRKQPRYRLYVLVVTDRRLLLWERAQFLMRPRRLVFADLRSDVLVSKPLRRSDGDLTFTLNDGRVLCMKATFPGFLGWPAKRKLLRALLG